MSRIYEALQREQGEIANIILPQLEREPGAAAAPGARPQQAALRPVPAHGRPRQAPVDAGEEDADPAARDAVLNIAARKLPIQLQGSGPLLPFDGTDAAAAEQYRIIRTRLLQHPKRPRLFLVTSADAGDGKTVTAINIAAALSLKGQDRILLADTDFRRSSIHTRLGFPVGPGLTDVLCGKATLGEALVQTEQFPSLYVATAGEPVHNPSELLESPQWAALLNEVRGEFGYVIADSPPVASVADYDLLQAACDAVVIVARPDHTKRSDLMRVLDIVPKEKSAGIVMNCVNQWFLGRHSHYASHYYARPAAGK